jgi:hypothetical protein
MNETASSLNPASIGLYSRDQAADLVDWIDARTSEPSHLGEVIDNLTSNFLPARPWESATGFADDIETLAWPWNRAANGLIDHGYIVAAVEVWSAHYLACLSIQLKYHQRFHKGMPLCNIGFALIKSGSRIAAAKAWLVGVVEDTLRRVATAPVAQNYRNLVKLGVAPAVLDQLITTVESRFMDRSAVPLFPEMVMDLWAHPTRITPREAYFRSIDELVPRLNRSYPRLPDTVNSWGMLESFWGFGDWSEGVLNAG